MMRRLGPVLFSLALPSLAIAQAVVTKQVLSQVYTIDKKYKSMEGPGSVERVYVGDPNSPELLWIVGIRTEVVGPDGKTPGSPELMCHVNVDLDMARHRALFDLKRSVAPRLITLSQGMLSHGSFSARLPKGFGFPLASNEPLIVYTQVLNHNIQKPKNLKVRHRVTFEYVRDRDLAEPMKPLFNLGASGMVLLQDNTVPSMGKPIAGAGEHGASCLMLPRAPNAAGMGSDYVDPAGRHLTGHWVVPPGRQVNHSDITWFLNLPYDTLLHYAAVHLHPFAKSLAILDMTTGEMIFEAKANGPKKGIGLAHVDAFTSEQGVPLYKDHQYELVSIYENPTKENADSMASAFLAVGDPEFVRPDPLTLTARAYDLVDVTHDTIAVARTNLGDFGIELLSDASPQTVRQFLRLVRSGAYEHAHIAAVDPAGVIQLQLASPLTDLQRALLKPIAVETAARHEPGALSLCPGEAAFAIVAGNGESRDGHCTAFARIGPGAAVIRQVLSTPRDFTGAPATPIEITKIDIYDMKIDAATISLAPVKTVAVR